MGKDSKFESLVSSVRGVALSNISTRVLNNCLEFVRARLPQSCVLCGSDGGGEGALCAPCRESLPWLAHPSCEVCASPLASGRVCGACLEQAPRFDRVEAAFAYRYPVDAMVQAFKYRGRLALARVLGRLLDDAVSSEVDVILPMPLSRGRIAERGFNQALELARVLAPRHRVELLADACRKVAETPPQAALPWIERAKNVRRAFVCDADLRGLRVAVVDDVLTTGATLNELARVLRRAGADQVIGWVVARALPWSSAADGRKPAIY